MPFHNVIIIGASGNLGPSIIAALDASHDFHISILSRELSKATFAPHIEVHRVPDNYPEDDLITAFKDQGAIINMAPITEVTLHKKIIDAAIKANVMRIILSEFGTNVPELQTTTPVPIFQGKVEIREYMKSKEGQGLTWTGLVAGAFFDWGLKDGLLGFDLKNKTATMFDSGNQYTNFTILSAVGKATRGILEHPAETADRYVFINSFRTTQKDVLEALEKTVGGEWNVKKTTCEEESRVGREKMGNDDWSGVGHAIMGASYSGGKYDFAQGRVLDNELLGLPVSEDLEEVVRKIVIGEEV